MKKSYLLASALLVGASAFAQEPQAGRTTINTPEAANVQIVKSSLRSLVGTDTAGWTTGVGNFLPDFDFANPTDSRYSGGEYQFVYGVNSSVTEVAQIYENINLAPVSIKGVIFRVVRKSRIVTQNDPASKLVVKAYSIKANGAKDYDAGTQKYTLTLPGPDKQLASKDLLISALDTTKYNFVDFDAPTANVKGNFAVAINFAAAAAKGDSIGLICGGDQSAAGYEKNVIQTLDPAKYYWYATDALLSSPNGTSVAVFAVADIFTAVNEFVNGVKISSVYPNPTANEAKISYTLEKNSNVQLEVFDLAGNTIQVENAGNQAAGTYNKTVDVSTLANGTYFYTITVNGHRLTKQLNVAK